MDLPWEGTPSRTALTEVDFESAARALGCSPAAIRAVWDVEAAGRHFRPDGSLVRRFEPHHFPAKHWRALRFEPRAGEAPWRASLRLSDGARDDMLGHAASLNLDAALRATSWGAPQIMGFNAETAGYASAAAMVRRMANSAPQQLDAFVALVRGWGLDGALRAHDWHEFARRYNGSGQVETYARRIEAAYRRHSGGEASPVVLRIGDRGPAVRRLQQALGVEDDGAFGPGTEAAVRAFQERRGLAVDGVVGAVTWNALQTDRAAEAEPVKPPPQPTPADDVAEKIQRGAASASVVLGVVESARRALPEEMLGWVVMGAVGLGLIAGLAWAIRYARAR